MKPNSNPTRNSLINEKSLNGRIIDLLLGLLTILNLKGKE
jgi:hypothetical protein